MGEYLILDTNGKQRASTTDLEELLREVMRRSFPAILRSFRSGQLGLWRGGKSVTLHKPMPYANSTDSLPFHGEELHSHQSPVVDRLAGHDGRGRDDFRAVPSVRRPGSTQCRCRLTCSILEDRHFGFGLVWFDLMCFGGK